jgi:tetratricopeptide (TPR) repeat protein
MDRQPARTLLEQLVRQSRRTVEENCVAFERTANQHGERASLSPRQLGRWMAGAIDFARPVMQRVAEHHWGHSFDRLIGPPSDEVLAIPNAVHGEGEEDLDRRTMLRAALAGTGVGLAVSALTKVELVRRSMDGVLEDSNVSDATIERWKRTAYEYAHSYQTVPPLQLLADVILDFAEVQTLLAQRQPVRYRRSLCGSAAEMAVLAGIFLSALGHQREARAWFHTAKLAADEAGDARLAGTAVVRAATVSLYYGSPAVALEQARQATTLLSSSGGASLVRAMVVEARALAKLGQQSGEARRLIGDAETTFGNLPDGEVSNTALGFTERQFWFTTGSAYTNLGLRTEAGQAQERALALYQPTEYLDPALIRLDQATCLLFAQQADAACELATITIADSPEQHRSGLITHYGREFYSRLPSAIRTTPGARQLQELLTVQA